MSNTGSTIRQINRLLFWQALDAYKAALASGNSTAIIGTSLTIHQAKGYDGVPKSWSKYVSQAFRKCGSPA